MKFNFTNCILALGLTVLMTACSGSGKPRFVSEWFTCSDDDGENYGFFNPGNGQTMYEGEFNNCPTSIIDGVFIVKEEGGVAVYGTDSKTPKVLGDLEELNEAGGVAEGLLPVCRKNSRIEVYSVSSSKASLAFTLDPIDGKEITSCSGSFVEGLLIVNNEDGMAGAVDKSGKLVIPFDYEGLNIPVGGLMIGRKGSDDGEDRYYLVNTKGTELFKFKKGLRPYYVFDNGYIACRNTDNYRIVLATQKEEYVNLSKDVNDLGEFFGDYLVFENNDNKCGILKVKGEEAEVIVRPKYRRLALVPWAPTKFVGMKDDEFALYNLDGETQVDFGDDYEFVAPVFTPNWKGFVAKEEGRNGEYVCFNSKGEKIKFDSLHEIYGLDYRANYSGTVSSDYFNVDEFVRQLSDAIAVTGLCGYKMGAYANQYFTSDMAPRGNTYAYWFTPKDEPDVKGYRYYSSIRLSAEKHLAEYSYYNYEFYYSWVANNPIDGMELTVNVPYDEWDVVGDKVKDTIKAKGFTVAETDSSSIVYYTPSKDAKLTLKWSYSTIKLTYYKNYGF